VVSIGRPGGDGSIVELHGCKRVANSAGIGYDNLIHELAKVLLLRIRDLHRRGACRSRRAYRRAWNFRVRLGNQSRANPKHPLPAAPPATRAPQTKPWKVELDMCTVGYINLQIRINKTERQCRLPGYTLYKKKKMNRSAGYIKPKPCKVGDLTST